MKKKDILPFIILFLIIICLIIGIFDYKAGISIANNFLNSFWFMISILPLVFILISLFDVWVKQDKVETHLGKNSGIFSYVWVFVLGATTIGPMLVSLPIAAALYKKGARLEAVFTYLGAASVCRIPMTLYEASCIGIRFTIIRYAVAIPLIIIFAKIFAVCLKNSSYKILKE